jgi:hypothetical protein
MFLPINNRFNFPAIKPTLDLSHPAARNIRLAAVGSYGGGMYDLVTNTYRSWSLAASRATIIGPTTFPNTTASGGIAWPAIIPHEVMPYLTMSVIWLEKASAHGQGVVTIDQTTSVVQITISSTGVPGVGTQGFGVFDNMPTVIPNHAYFFVMSQIPGTPHSKNFCTLLDIMTGQIWIGHDRGLSWAPQTCGVNYSTLTYQGGVVDNNPVGCASISAVGLTQAQQLAWVNDPWGLWYKRTPRALTTMTGRRVIVGVGGGGGGGAGNTGGAGGSPLRFD